MQARKFAGEIQAKSVPRNILAHPPAMKALKNVLTRGDRDGAASVLDAQDDIIAFFPRRDADHPARQIIFPRVLQQILHDQGDVAPFAGDAQIEEQSWSPV